MTPPTEKPFEPTMEACPIASSVAQRVIARAQVGLDKYGTNLTRTDLNHGQWLQHLQDELLDAANYVERLKAEVAELAKDKARLDWIEENCGYYGGGDGGTYNFTSPLDTECFRQAIDAAMNPK